MKIGSLIGAVMTVFAAFSLGDRSLAANDSGAVEASLPNGPFLNAVSDFSAWQILYSYPSDKAKANRATAPAQPQPAPLGVPPPPRTLTVTRTKPLWHAETIDTAGGKMDQWCDGAVRFFVEKGLPPRLTPSGRGFDTEFPNFSAMTFPDMDWISASTYVGTEIMDSRKCLVFSKGDMKAWIDSETRFPVRWQRGEIEMRIFRQLTPPNEMLILPSDVSKISSEIKHDRALLMRPVPN